MRRVEHESLIVGSGLMEWMRKVYMAFCMIEDTRTYVATLFDEKHA
jgi:hypothetical protein